MKMLHFRDEKIGLLPCIMTGLKDIEQLTEPIDKSELIYQVGLSSAI